MNNVKLSEKYEQELIKHVNDDINAYNETLSKQYKDFTPTQPFTRETLKQCFQTQLVRENQPVPFINIGDFVK